MASLNDIEVADLKARLLMAEIEMNGMIAENNQREILGHSMAYGYDEFIELITKYSIGFNDIPGYRGD